VGIGEVFEDEMPSLGVRVPMRVEAARHERRRHRRGDLIVECDLLAPGVPIQPLGQPSFEEDGTRGVAGVTVIGETQPHDTREDRGARAFHRDVMHPAGAQHPAPAQHLG
jgi:hypothetical protein